MYIRTTDRPLQEWLQYSLGDSPVSTPEADARFKRVASLVTDGLKMAKHAIPELSTGSQREFLGFITTVLENFFPRGHGLIDEHGKVLRQSQRGTIEIPVVAKDGSRWGFEHRVRLYLSDQKGFRRSGDHFTGHFSSIRLFARELHGTTSTNAAGTALHEMIHMMFAMIRRFERWLGTIGAEGAARLLSRQPWRLLVLTGFAAHRERLERHVRDLLRVLPIPMGAGELAASLVEEAFAAMFEVIVDEAIARSSHTKRGTRGPAVLVSSGFPPKAFIRYYVLEKGFAVTEKQLDSRDARPIFERMTKDVDALAAALLAHLDSR